jgi:hypothetical protein
LVVSAKWPIFVVLKQQVMKSAFTGENESTIPSENHNIEWLVGIGAGAKMYTLWIRRWRVAKSKEDRGFDYYNFIRNLSTNCLHE